MLDNGEQGRRIWTDTELTTYMDWYRSDLSHLFFYFDDLEDLAPGSKFRAKVEKEAEAKRRIVRKHMTYQIGRTIEAWRQALESFPRLSEATPVERSLPLQFPLQAKLPPPTPGRRSN